LSDALDETKKLKKVDNLLTDLRNKGEIMNIGSRKEPIWQLQGIKIKLGIN
jgi:ATP-dependent DNA helicase RecG